MKARVSEWETKRQASRVNVESFCCETRSCWRFVDSSSGTLYCKRCFQIDAFNYIILGIKVYLCKCLRFRCKLPRFVWFNRALDHRDHKYWRKLIAEMGIHHSINVILLRNIKSLALHRIVLKLKQICKCSNCAPCVCVPQF